MKVATWNVNSVAAREERLLRFLARHGPDVVCLQELKVTEDRFPFAALEEAGYHARVHGQKTYNGVAILSRQPAREVERDMGDGADDPQARFLSAVVEGVRVISVYVPNGQEVGSDKWAYKLAWLRRLRAHLDRRFRPTDPVVVCGDFNVAPEPRDVARPDEWEATVLFHPEGRAALAELGAWGLEDVFRRHHPEGGFYSWWDYRMLAFPKGNGLRIDHVLASPALAARSTGSEIDRNERKGKQPSDHAPVLATFA